VVDQGISKIAGYCDDEDVVYKTDLPMILFGDHTRVFKFLDFPFATGADGTRLLKPNAEIADPLFLYYGLRNLNIPNRGYNRHYSLLREQVLLMPREIAERRKRTIHGEVPLSSCSSELDAPRDHSTRASHRKSARDTPTRSACRRPSLRSTRAARCARARRGRSPQVPIGLCFWAAQSDVLDDAGFVVD